MERERCNAIQLTARFGETKGIRFSDLLRNMVQSNIAIQIH